MPSLNQKICSVEGCTKPKRLTDKNYCAAHYGRVHRTGSVGEGPIHSRFVHGMRKHPMYSTWDGMKQRCSNSNTSQYTDYGGRGIKVCDRWDNFANFLADMGERPEGMTLDRKDNNKGYNPENCKWSTRQEQNRNQRRTKLSLEKAREIRFLYAQGGVTHMKLAERYGVGHTIIGSIINNKIW